MNKIILTINAMVANEPNINNVIKGSIGNTIYFKYKNYLWSMSKISKNEYSLNYYPDENLNINNVINDIPNPFESPIDTVSYYSSNFKSIEAKESFSALYNILQERLFDINHVMDDIINDTKNSH